MIHHCMVTGEAYMSKDKSLLIMAVVSRISGSSFQNDAQKIHISYTAKIFDWNFLNSDTW